MAAASNQSTYAGTHFTHPYPGRMESGKEGHPNIQPSNRPGIEPGTSGLGGRDLNHCANPSAFLLLFSSFFPYLFRFNFVVSERNVHILFCRHIWAELSHLFWTFLSETFSQVRGGGCTCTPPCVRACIILQLFIFYIHIYIHTDIQSYTPIHTKTGTRAQNN